MTTDFMAYPRRLLLAVALIVAVGAMHAGLGVLSATGDTGTSKPAATTQVAHHSHGGSVDPAPMPMPAMPMSGANHAGPMCLSALPEVLLLAAAALVLLGLGAPPGGFAAELLRAAGWGRQRWRRLIRPPDLAALCVLRV